MEVAVRIISASNLRQVDSFKLPKIKVMVVLTGVNSGAEQRWVSACGYYTSENCLQFGQTHRFHVEDKLDETMHLQFQFLDDSRNGANLGSTKATALTDIPQIKDANRPKPNDLYQTIPVFVGKYQKGSFRIPNLDADEGLWDA